MPPTFVASKCFVMSWKLTAGRDTNRCRLGVNQLERGINRPFWLSSCHRIGYAPIGLSHTLVSVTCNQLPTHLVCLNYNLHCCSSPSWGLRYITDIYRFPYFSLIYVKRMVLAAIGRKFRGRIVHVAIRLPGASPRSTVYYQNYCASLCRVLVASGKDR